MTPVGDRHDRRSAIDLARERNFILGGVKVCPSSSEVVVGEETIRLQPRVTQVLVALARAGGEVVSRDELLSSCWGGLAIGDDAINRCIGRLRRLAEQEAPGAFAIETLPRIGYRLTRSAAASGSEEEQIAPIPAAPLLSTAKKRKRALNALWAAGGLLLLPALAALWIGLGRPGWPQGPDGVAVALLDSEASETIARRFAATAADQLNGYLAKADIKALPLESRFPSGLERDAAALRMGAAFLVSGRVEHQAEALVVSVNIDDTRRHEVLWSASLSRPSTEAQSLGDQLAAKVTDVLHCALDATNFNAAKIDDRDLALYLNACDAEANGDAARARDEFRRLVQREPRFAQAWGGLALIDVAMAEDLSSDQFDESIKEGRAAAQRALQLNPKVGDAYAALAELTPSKQLWERQKLLRTGLKAAPENAMLNHSEALFLSAVGSTSEATVFAQRAADLAPWQPFWSTELSQFLAHAGRAREARDVMDRTSRIWPEDDFIESVKISNEARVGDPNVALTLLNDPKTTPHSWTDGFVEEWRRYIKARTSHDPSLVKLYADDVLDRLHSGKLNVNQALVRLNSLGATDAAFEAVRTSLASSIDTEAFFRQSPDGTAMWRDARFMPMASRFGLVDYWKKSGVWPDFCQGAYDCSAAAAAATATGPKKG